MLSKDELIQYETIITRKMFIERNNYHPKKSLVDLNIFLTKHIVFSSTDQKKMFVLLPDK
jgi:hypothetical protein